MKIHRTNDEQEPLPAIGLRGGREWSTETKQWLEVERNPHPHPASAVALAGGTQVLLSGSEGPGA